MKSKIEPNGKGKKLYCSYYLIQRFFLTALMKRTLKKKVNEIVGYANLLIRIFFLFGQEYILLFMINSIQYVECTSTLCTWFTPRTKDFYRYQMTWYIHMYLSACIGNMNEYPYSGPVNRNSHHSSQLIENKTVKYRDA